MAKVTVTQEDIDALSLKADAQADAIAAISLKLTEVAQEIKDLIAAGAQPSAALLAIAAKIDANTGALGNVKTGLDAADADLDAEAGGGEEPPEEV